MSANEEVEEHAQHAREPFDKRVAASMAIIAAMLAIVSVLGHILTTEELLHQQQASDQWAYSQAKDIRHYVAQAAHDIINEGKGNPDVVGKYGQDDARYKSDTAGIQEKARELEQESRKSGREAFRMHAGEVFLEVAIVLSSLAILAKRQWLWLSGIASAAVGAAVALTALLVT
jgi:hypothetical protein